MLAFIERAICSKTSPALRRRRTSAAIVLYLATKGTVGLCRLLSSIRAGGRLAARCTARALLTASVLMPKSCESLATLARLMRQSMRCARKTSKSRGKSGLSGPENKRVFRSRLDGYFVITRSRARQAP